MINFFLNSLATREVINSGDGGVVIITKETSCKCAIKKKKARIGKTA